MSHVTKDYGRIQARFGFKSLATRLDLNDSVGKPRFVPVNEDKRLPL